MSKSMYLWLIRYFLCYNDIPISCKLWILETYLQTFASNIFSLACHQGFLDLFWNEIINQRDEALILQLLNFI
jgi:hypothetical protein